MKSSTEIYDFLSSVISAAPYGVMAIDMEGDIVMLNERALKYLAIPESANKIIEKDLIHYLNHLPDFQKVLHQCVNIGRESFDLTIQSTNQRHLSIRGRHILKGMLLTIEDITAYKQMEMATLNAMLEGQEKERRRWAQEIHDGIGPLLSSIKMNLDEVQDEVLEKVSERNKKKLPIVQNLLKSVTSEIRSISHDLMPSALEDFGLVAALKDLCNKKQSTGRPNLEFLSTGNINRLPSLIELALYRAGQELLHNAIKYSNASLITLQLIKHPESIMMIVEDDGVGFDKKDLSTAQGIGLRNIETRIESTNGIFELDTQKGNGVVVTIEIPLEKVL